MYVYTAYYSGEGKSEPLVQRGRIDEYDMMICAWIWSQHKIFRRHLITYSVMTISYNTGRWVWKEQEEEEVYVEKRVQPCVTLPLSLSPLRLNEKTVQGNNAQKCIHIT